MNKLLHLTIFICLRFKSQKLAQMSKTPEKQLREILNRDVENMNCFECGKSPVSFVNLISWSFCCQTCAGFIVQLHLLPMN